MSSLVTSPERSVIGKITRSGLDTRKSRPPAATVVSSDAAIPGVLRQRRPSAHSPAGDSGDARDALVRPLAVATCDLDAPIIAGRTPYEPPIAVGHECVAEVVEAADAGLERGTLVSVPFQISCGACERCHRGLTGNCKSVPFLSMYGFGSFGGDWGGFLS